MNGCNLKVLYIPVLIVSILMTQSCIREDLQCAANASITVTVRIADGSGSTDDGSIINNIVLYIFDENEKILETRETQLDKAEVLSYPNAEKLTVVAWCNTLSGSVNVTSFDNNERLGNGMISLKEVASSGIYQIPDDIFYGSRQVINNRQIDEHAILYVTRVVGSMNITVRNLKKYAGFDDNNYSFIVGTTPINIDFTGRYSGGGASFIPPAAFNAQNEFITNTFRLFPSADEQFSVKILHDDTLVDEVLTDNDGNPLRIVTNKTLNLLIDYTDLSNISVAIKTTEWNETYQWSKIFY